MIKSTKSDRQGKLQFDRQTVRVVYSSRIDQLVQPLNYMLARTVSQLGRFQQSACRNGKRNERANSNIDNTRLFLLFWLAACGAAHFLSLHKSKKI